MQEPIRLLHQLRPVIIMQHLLHHRHLLLQKEVLFQADVENLIGKRPFEEKKHITDEVVNPHPSGEISAGVPPYDSNIPSTTLG